MDLYAFASFYDGSITVTVNYDTTTLKIASVVAANNAAQKTLSIGITNGQQTRTFSLLAGTSRTITNLPNAFVIDQANAPVVVWCEAA